MQIKTITVRYGRTQSLEQYSNVRPEVTLSAELEEGDDSDVAMTILYAEARAFVEEAIDQAIEQDGRAAKFSSEPRYQVIHTASVFLGNWNRERRQDPPERLIIILPNLPTLERSKRDDGLSRCWWTHPHPVSRKLRLSHAYTVAREHIAEHPDEGYRLIDASDGDLSRVPAWVFEPVPEPEPAPQLASAHPSEYDGDDLDRDEDDDDDA